MSKQTDDLIDRIQGSATALKGVRANLSPPAPAPTPADVSSAPNPAVTQEDYDHAKQVIAELKGNVEQLEAAVSRDSKVPGEHSDIKSNKASESSSLPKAKV